VGVNSPTDTHITMKTITILSAEESAQLLTWCKCQKLEQEIFTGRPTCRLKRWWGLEAEFYFTKSHVEKRSPIDEIDYLQSLKEKFNPEANSILLYKYNVGGEIGEHLDKQCFAPSVTLINIIESAPDIFGNYEPTKFRWNRQNYYLQHGEVVEFNSRVLHSIPKVKTIRYSLQFRVIQ